ncbi:MAG: ABC transporter substrate-binding protein [Desulfosarcinaceae bacterium]
MMATAPKKAFLLLLSVAIFIISGCNSDIAPVGTDEARTGISTDEILVGASLALDGHAGYLGTQTLHGAMAFIKYVNESGGVHGRRIRIIKYDDGYDPPRCVLNTQRLVLQDKVFALFCYVGTPTTVKIIPLVQEARIPLVGMFTGAHALREPVSRYLVNVRASYYQETGAAVRYLVEKRDLTKLAVFYQYDAYGFDGLRGTELALKKYDLLPVATGSYVRGTLNVEDGLDKIMAAGAQAVVMIGSYEPCARFIRLAKTRGFHPVFYNVSFVGADELIRRLGPDAQGVIITQVVPPPEPMAADDRLWGALEYVQRLRKYFPDDQPNFVSLEGYINAKVLVEGLRRAGPDLDRDRFLDAIESIQDLDLGIDNPLSFSADDHQGLERVYFTLYENGHFTWLNE